MVIKHAPLRKARVAPRMLLPNVVDVLLKGARHAGSLVGAERALDREVLRDRVSAGNLEVGLDLLGDELCVVHGEGNRVPIVVELLVVRESFKGFVEAVEDSWDPLIGRGCIGEREVGGGNLLLGEVNHKPSFLGHFIADAKGSKAQMVVGGEGISFAVEPDNLLGIMPLRFQLLFQNLPRAFRGSLLNGNRILVGTSELQGRKLQGRRHCEGFGFVKVFLGLCLVLVRIEFGQPLCLHPSLDFLALPDQACYLCLPCIHPRLDLGRGSCCPIGLSSADAVILLRKVMYVCGKVKRLVREASKPRGFGGVAAGAEVAVPAVEAGGWHQKANVWVVGLHVLNLPAGDESFFQVVGAPLLLKCPVRLAALVGTLFAIYHRLAASSIEVERIFPFTHASRGRRAVWVCSSSRRPPDLVVPQCGVEEAARKLRLEEETWCRIAKDLVP